MGKTGLPAGYLWDLYGSTVSRRKRLTFEEHVVRDMRGRGESWRGIARSLKCSIGKVKRLFRDAEAKWNAKNRYDLWWEQHPEAQQNRSNRSDQI